MVHETHWNSRGARSSPTCGSPAFCAGEIVGESGCGGRLQFVIRQPLETSLAARRCADAAGQASPGARAEVVAAGTAEIAGGTAPGFTALGLRTRRVVGTARAGFDSSAICRGLSPRLCRNALTSARLESAKARAACSRAPRSRNRPLAERALAAVKKRAPSGKLAWFLSMKVASCCSRCVVACGPSAAILPCNMPGTDTIALQRWQPCAELRGRAASACITIFWTITLAPRTSFDSCAACMITCDDLCCSFATASRPIDPRYATCSPLAALGSAPSGSQVTRLTSTLWKVFGTNPNTATSPIGSQATSSNCMKPWTNCSANTAQDPDRLHSFFAAAQLSI